MLVLLINPESPRDILLGDVRPGSSDDCGLLLFPQRHCDLFHRERSLLTDLFDGSFVDLLLLLGVQIVGVEVKTDHVAAVLPGVAASSTRVCEVTGKADCGGVRASQAWDEAFIIVKSVGELGHP